MLANIAQGDRLTKGRLHYNGYIKVNAYFGAYTKMCSILLIGQ